METIGPELLLAAIGVLIFAVAIYSILAKRPEYKKSLFKDTYLTKHTANFTKPPYRYENNRILAVTVKTKRSVLRSLVPRVLKINKENKLIFYIGSLNIVHPYRLSYKEGGILIPVEYRGKSRKKKKSYYVPILFLDKTKPLIDGREIYGFNKHQTTIEFKQENKTVRASISTGSNILFDIKLRVKKIEKNLREEIRHGGYITTKRVPSSNNDEKLEVHKLNLCKVSNVFVTEKISGDAELELGEADNIPISKIPVLKILSSAFNTGNSVLEDGDVIHNYM